MYGQIDYYGNRFSGNDDTAIFPAYTQVNAGVLWSVNRRLDLQFHIDNVNNSSSFTEGGSITAGNVLSDGRYVGLPVRCSLASAKKQPPGDDARDLANLDTLFDGNSDGIDYTIAGTTHANSSG